MNAIEKLITEDGKHVLDLRAVEGKKEKEYVERQDKLDKLTEKQDAETSKLSELINPSLSALQGLLGALDEPANPAPMVTNGGGRPYTMREDDDSARATSLAASPIDDVAGRLQSRIFVLPPTNSDSPQQAAADTIKRQLSVELHADQLARQYQEVDPDKVTVAAPPQSPLPGFAPLGTNH